MIRIESTAAFACPGPRENQEDFIYPADINGSERIFVLCDGMGGHGHGEVASRTVATAVYEQLKSLGNCGDYTPAQLQQAVDLAQQRLNEADVYDDARKMGTTLVVVALNRMEVLVGHIGDSRCYQFSRDGELKFQTKDHSKVQEAVDAEILTEEEAWSNPMKNLLTRCIMAGNASATLDVDTLRVADGDLLLLCSDGVTDAMRRKQLQALVIDRATAEIAEMVKTECTCSSHDNFSAIFLRLEQDEEYPAHAPASMPEYQPIYKEPVAATPAAPEPAAQPKADPVQRFSPRNNRTAALAVVALGVVAAACIFFSRGKDSAQPVKQTEATVHIERPKAAPQPTSAVPEKSDTQETVSKKVEATGDLLKELDIQPAEEPTGKEGIASKEDAPQADADEKSEKISAEGDRNEQEPDSNQM